MITILTLFFWLLIGTATGYFAKQRGRDPFLWFMIGIFLGILGLLLLFILPVVSLSEQEEIIEKASGDQDPYLAHSEHHYLICDWFYLDGEHNQQGPITFEVLKKMWSDGKIGWKTFVWCPEMSEWKKVEEMVELKDILASE